MTKPFYYASTPRAEPEKRQAGNEVKGNVGIVSMNSWNDILCTGYTSLSENPEIVAGVNTIARLIGSMTIHLMQNTNKGDIRLKNELSRKVDVNPYSNSTRSLFFQWIIKTLMLNGNGNCIVLPKTKEGLLIDLLPIPHQYVSFVQEGIFNYKVMVNGEIFDPQELLHFVLNPQEFFPWKGEGYKIALKDVAHNLKQAATTEKGFMESNWKPSLIVKVDALIDEFSSPQGREKLLNNYVKTANAGEPWILPAEQFEVEQVKPLSLSDLALSDFVELDKKTVASILGVPPFILGVGDFKRDEWNSFINSTIMPLAKSIEQELTKKLLYSPDLFFRFNPRSLYNYDLKDLASVGDEQYVRGIMTGNEVRDWIGLTPLEGLDELVILENYIPLGNIGDQSKIKRG